MVVSENVITGCAVVERCPIFFFLGGAGGVILEISIVEGDDKKRQETKHRYLVTVFRFTSCLLPGIILYVPKFLHTFR